MAAAAATAAAVRLGDANVAAAAAAAPPFPALLGVAVLAAAAALGFRAEAGTAQTMGVDGGWWRGDDGAAAAATAATDMPAGAEVGSGGEWPRWAASGGVVRCGVAGREAPVLVGGGVDGGGVIGSCA